MCGIAGFILAAHTPPPDDPSAVLESMADALRHRGPDSSGVWHDPAAGLGLGHRRLAVIDLSPDGHQPMVSAGGRYVLSFNGEIYNFRELRAELIAAGHPFRGHGDTEVLLAGIEQWGIERILERSLGMFAFALWDRRSRELHLVRDRLGEKPLYVAATPTALLFGSELRAMRAFPGFEPEIDRDVLASYLRYGYTPDPHCIYRRAIKLPAGTHLVLRAQDVPGADPRTWGSRCRPYWSAIDIAETAVRAPAPRSEEAAVDALDGVLRRAVTSQMTADVRLGAFLSGGVDSSIVVALMQAEAGSRARTFTIGFEEGGLDEAPHARSVASHLRTEHTEIYVRARDALDVVPRLPEIYDEPFADSSQIPTFLLVTGARQHVTVALTGDGGDESFGGYRQHVRASRLAPLFGIPRPLRAWAGGLLKSASPATWDRLLPRTGASGTGAGRLGGRRIHDMATVLALADEQAMHQREVSRWADPESLVRGGREPPSLLTPLKESSVESSMLWDTLTYLPGDILVKVDRASMAVSLETRCPLLDPRVVDFAWSLPLGLKVKGGTGKRILRRVLNRYVPRSLTARPKQGFAPPLSTWIRHELRDWVENLLDRGKLERTGILRAEPIRAAWDRHLSGERDAADSLWTVLMFQAWHERWHGSRG